ncbi:MAG: hypothetical protein ABSH30_08155 [Acidimicrobiales bacterium]
MAGAALSVVAGMAFGCTLAGCSGHPVATTTTTVPSRSATYSFGGVTVRAAFPGTPLKTSDPLTLAALMPPHTSVTTWTIGDVGRLQVHSYELVMARFPVTATTASIDRFLTGYAGTPNLTRYGNPALQKFSTIPLSGGTRYSGITAFTSGRVLVMAVGFDATKASVTDWLASVVLVSPSAEAGAPAARGA